MPETNSRWLWYERPGFVIGALIVFWPVGLALMWAQRKFSHGTRIGVSVAAVVATVLVILAATSSPSPRATVDSASVVPAAPTTASPLATAPSVVPTSGASGGATTTVGKPSAKVQAPTTTSPPRPATQPSNPKAPVSPPAPDPTGEQRFTMTGTTRSTSDETSLVTFALKAAAASDAVKYDWWVYTPSGATTYSGQTVSASYYGLAPTSILLIVRKGDATAKSYNADVVEEDGRLSATGK